MQADGTGRGLHWQGWPAPAALYLVRDFARRLGVPLVRMALREPEANKSADGVSVIRLVRSVATTDPMRDLDTVCT